MEQTIDTSLHAYIERWTVGAYLQWKFDDAAAENREWDVEWIYLFIFTFALYLDTAAIYNKFKGVNHLMIEANYDPDHPRFNTLSETYINRVRLAHLSIAQANDFIKNNIDDVRSLATVTLLHLSSRHADRQDFKKLTIKTLRELGSNATVEVATPWLVRDLPNFNKPNF